MLLNTWKSATSGLHEKDAMKDKVERTVTVTEEIHRCDCFHGSSPRPQTGMVCSVCERDFCDDHGFELTVKKPLPFHAETQVARLFCTVKISLCFASLAKMRTIPPEEGIKFVLENLQVSDLPTHESE